MKRTTLGFIVVLSACNSGLVNAEKVEIVSIEKSINNWSGFYAGINGGYTFSNDQHLNTNATNTQYCTVAQGCAAGLEDSITSITGATKSTSLNNAGFIGGGQLGYNKRILNNYIIGLITDFQGITDKLQNASASSTINTSVGGLPQSLLTNINVSSKIDYIGTLRGNFGYLLNKNIYISASGGLAYGAVKSITSIGQTYGIPSSNLGIANHWETAGSYSNVRVGWTAGAFLEWMFRESWSVNIGYLYYNLGSVTYSGGNLIAPITVPNNPQIFFANNVSATNNFDGHIIRAGLNYHFA